MSSLDSLRNVAQKEQGKLQALQNELNSATERLARGKRQLSEYPNSDMKDKRYAALVNAIKAEQAKVDAITPRFNEQKQLYTSAKRALDSAITASSGVKDTKVTIESLTKLRNDAINIGDNAAVEKYNKQINSLKAKQAGQEQVVTSGEVSSLAKDAAPDANALWRKNDTWSGVISAIQSNDAASKISLAEGATGVVRNGVEIALVPNPSGKFVLGGDNASVITMNDFRKKIYAMSSVEIKALQKSLNLKQTGFYQDVIGDAVEAATQLSIENYRNAIRVAESKTGTIAESPYSFDVYAKMLKAATGGGGGGTSRTRTVTNFDAADAEIILNNYYTDTLGRSATASEIKKFQDVINRQAKSRPSVTTTSTSGTTSTVTSQAGFSTEDAQLLAQKQAYAAPGATGFLAATKYMDVINDMIRNPLG